MFVLVVSSISAAAEDYRSSEFFKSRTKGMLSDSWLKEADRKIRNNSLRKDSFYVAMGKHIACPYWTGYRGVNNREEAKMLISNDLRARHVRNLKGYPKKTIDTCSKPSFLIDGGKTTKDPRNKKAWTSVKATVVIVDKNKSKGRPLRAFILNDYLFARSGGVIYNAQLQKVCDFKFKSKTSASVDCGVLGRGDVEFKITNVLRGKFRLFGMLGERKILASNLSPDQLKQKYPDIVD